MNFSATTSTTTGTGPYHLVIFRLDRQVYGLAIDRVVQIIPMVKITPLPQVNPLLEGVINVRGSVAPVISVRRSLGLGQAPFQLYTPIILAQICGHLTGLIVDEVLDVQSFAADQVVPAGTIIPQGMESSPVLEGLVYLEGLTILLLNPERLLQPSQIQAVLSAMPERVSCRAEEAATNATAPAQPDPIIQNEPAAVEPITAASLPFIATLGSSCPQELSMPVPGTGPVTSAAPALAEPAPCSGETRTPQRQNRRARQTEVAERVMQQFNDLGSDLPPADSR